MAKSMPGVVAKFFWKGKWIDSRLDYRMKISVERDVDNLHPQLLFWFSLVIDGSPGLNATSGSCSFLGFTAFRGFFFGIFGQWGYPAAWTCGGSMIWKKMCSELYMCISCISFMWIRDEMTDSPVSEQQQKTTFSCLATKILLNVPFAAVSLGWSMI